MGAKTCQGGLVAPKGRFAVIVSRFNEFVTSRLLAGALDAFTRHGVAEEDVEVFWTPGSWEIPVVCRRVAESGRYLAVVCLGAVIRGGTVHWEYIASEAAKGVAAAAVATGVPCIFGILTTDSIEQAIERAGTKGGNKGADAAVAAIEMANLMPLLPAPGTRKGRS